jgi:hypothetical protein
MTITGTVRNGAIVPDVASPWPEGAKVTVSDDDFKDAPGFDARTLPADHPMAPYDRDAEVALILESIAGIDRGEPTIPLRQAFEELSRKHGLGPMPAE